MRANSGLSERKRRQRERLKLLTANMTNYGYAFMGSAFLDPVLGTERLRPINFILFATALVLHALASYVVPEGEKP